MFKQLAVATAVGAGLLVAPVAQADTNCSVPIIIYTGGYPGSPGNVATPGGIFPWDNGGFDHGQTVGAANAVAMADAAAADCPDAPIYLVGHSYGAAIMHTALETIDKREYAGRVHVVLTGNPRHPGGVEDTLEGLSSIGITFRGEGIKPENIGFFEDTCNPRDGICDFPGSSQPVTTSVNIWGYLTGAHRYPKGTE